MNREDIDRLIDTKLGERKASLRNRNTVDALTQLFPPANALWKVLAGTKKALALEKTQIIQDTILDILLAIDEKLETGQAAPRTFGILLEGVVSHGDVTGLKANTSNPVLAQLFSDQDVNVILRDIAAAGNVTGVDLIVDQELELKKKLHVEAPGVRVDFNADPNCKITFGRVLKRKNDK